MKKSFILGTLLAGASLGMVASCATTRSQAECATAHATFIATASAVQQCHMSPKCLLTAADNERLNIAQSRLITLCDIINIPAPPAVVPPMNTIPKNNSEKFVLPFQR